MRSLPDPKTADWRLYHALSNEWHKGLAAKGADPKYLDQLHQWLADYETHHNGRK